METRLQISLLLSFYGALLTQRQREALKLHYEEDCSLSEIAEMTGVTRQGAHDAIRRGEERLMELEETLRVAARWKRLRDEMTAARDALDEGRADEARQRIDRLLEEEA